MLILALFSAFFVAGPGPVSIIVGSVATVAAANTFAHGLIPKLLPFSADPTSAIAAPSTMPDELPAV